MPSILTVINQTDKMRPLWIEPEGADFWMAPGQEFELRIEAATVNGQHFHIDDNGDSLQVYPAEASVGYIAVFSAGQELECGYQRPLDYLPVAQQGVAADGQGVRRSSGGPLAQELADVRAVSRRGGSLRTD